jgi:hypothetical protein
MAEEKFEFENKKRGVLYNWRLKEKGKQDCNNKIKKGSPGKGSPDGKDES